MILDAGCGNRAMWEEKEVEGIIYCDIETNLQRKLLYLLIIATYLLKVKVVIQYFMIHLSLGMLQHTPFLVTQIKKCSKKEVTRCMVKYQLIMVLNVTKQGLL
jgi:hypothetical protein